MEPRAPLPNLNTQLNRLISETMNLGSLLNIDFFAFSNVWIVLAQHHPDCRDSWQIAANLLLVVIESHSIWRHCNPIESNAAMAFSAFKLKQNESHINFEVVVFLIVFCCYENLIEFIGHPAWLRSALNRRKEDYLKMIIMRLETSLSSSSGRMWTSNADFSNGGSCSQTIILEQKWKRKEGSAVVTF